MNADRKAPVGSSSTGPIGPMDFSTFVLSLGSSAMVNLGMVVAPEDDIRGDKPRSVDLPSAKQIIDILAVLKDKTEGNLEPAEEKLLTSLLYDLRIHYVDAQKAQAQ